MDNIMKDTRHGFIACEITEDQHIFGIQQTPLIIQDNGNWRDSFPPFERQARAFFDTSGCSIYNTLTPIEILDRKLFKEDSEYAERFVYIGTNTRPPGNNPHVIGEWIRKNGLIPESLLPFNDLIQGLNDYASPNPLIADLIEEGKRWLQRKTFNHDWIIGKDKTDALKEALRSSPLGVSVSPLEERGGIYYRTQEQDVHWTCLVAYEGNAPVIFDSYAPFIKRLEPNFNFGFAKRYSLKRNTDFSTTSRSTFLQLLGRYFREIMK
mgnify:CR=1 FL=1